MYKTHVYCIVVVYRLEPMESVFNYWTNQSLEVHNNHSSQALLRGGGGGGGSALIFVRTQF